MGKGVGERNRPPAESDSTVEENSVNEFNSVNE